MGSGASRWLTVVLVVRAVSFIVLLAFTEMLLKPNSDGPSEDKKCITSHKQVLNIVVTLHHTMKDKGNILNVKKQNKNNNNK